MTPFAELAASSEYWLTKIQNELYACVEEYLEKNRLTRTQFAQELNVSKGYVSQILNGDFDHKLSKLIDLSLAVGIVPNVKFQPTADYVEDYLSGYDLCLNQQHVQATIQVTIDNTPHDTKRDKPQAIKYMLSDSETTIRYTYTNPESFTVELGNG